MEKNQNFCAHARAVRELLSVTFWVFTVLLWLCRIRRSLLLRGALKLLILMLLSSRRIRIRCIISGISLSGRPSEY